mgnify:CR=1 FL=1
MANGFWSQIANLYVGKRFVDNTHDVLQAHKKSSDSRADLQRTIDEAELIEKSKEKTMRDQGQNNNEKEK